LEVCKVEVGNRKDGRRLSPDQVTEVLKFTTKKPSEKQALVREGLRLLNYGGSPTVTSWGFQVNQEPMTLKGRVLQAPLLQVKDRSNKDVTVQPGNGTYGSRSSYFASPFADGLHQTCAARSF
jgi:eukaryotic translation initiation factor 2C